MLCLLKLALLVLYLVLIIFVAVLSDVVRLYNMSFVTSSSTANVVDAKSLATETLESILRQRGVTSSTAHNYYHFLQYQESSSHLNNRSHHSALQHQHHRRHLLQLVELSGLVRVEEILDLDSLLLHEWNNEKLSSTVGSIITLGAEHRGSRSREPVKGSSGLWGTPSSGSDLLGEIEDRTRDASWLILVRLRGGASLLDQASWQEVIGAVSHFGIRTAVFDCSRDRWICDRRNWVVPQLILTLPENHANSTNKLLKHKKELLWHYSYNLHKPRQVVNWVARQLANQVHRLQPSDLSAWEKFDSGLESSHKLRIILVSKTEQPPMFLSAIAVRFSSRIDVGIIDMAYMTEISSHLKPINQLIAIPSTTSYIVLTPLSGMIVYGERAGEALNFRRMEIFLNFMVPEARSIFTVTLALVNLMLCIELFLFSSSRLLKHILSWISRVLKYNAALLLVWLGVIALMQSRFHCVDKILEQALTVLAQKFFNGSYIGCLLRSQWPFISCFRVLAVSVFIFGSAVAIPWWQVRPRTTPPSSQHPPTSSTTSLLPQFSSSLSSSTSTTQNGDVFTTPLLAATGADFPMFHHHYSGPHRQLSWIERGSGARSVVLLNQLFGQVVSLQRMSLSQAAAAATSTTADTMTGEGNAAVVDVAGHVSSAGNPNHFMHLTSDAAWLPLGVSLDYISQLPKWRFKFANVDEVHNLSQSASQSSLAVEGSEENEAVLLQYAKFPAGMLPSLICSICLERYRSETTEDSNNGSHGTKKYGGDTLCGLPCGHAFHAHCVLNWLTRDHHVCPICRWPSYQQKQNPPEKNRDSWGDWDLGSPV
ncbi:E3 ubiquitin-protein ligase RNF103-like [Galendromus occidentalis]|uniref:E3 ubiquitin-protein ligase RNF103-like n=1 Tax=Galendromus occidentalis TaxID=34638 RepID=A0AAJ7SJI1_9ACAR|nr:E3 ubiquitin-protein ligase RNF103-like [Galendromus occidentalis]